MSWWIEQSNTPLKQRMLTCCLFSHEQMTGYQPPPTRKKPTDNAREKYEVNEHNMQDGIQQADDKDRKREYVYKGE
jgi:hypothetical protein